MNGTQQLIGQEYGFPMSTHNDFLSKEEIEILHRTMLAPFDEDERHMFIRVCQRTRLDPFTRQLYPTRRYVKSKDSDGNVVKKPSLVTVTGIMGLTAVAERTQQYDGCEIAWSGPDGVWRPEWLADEYPAAARCTVYRKNRKYPEVAIARWFSFVGQSYNYQTKQWEVGDFWSKMPDFMLAKCAKAAALRGAFPDQLSNVYIREELDSDVTDSEATETIPADEAKIAENQRRSDEAKQHGLPEGVKIVAQSGGARPSPAEALEPAFAEDRIPAKPKTPAAPAAPTVATPERKLEIKEEPGDELDMSAPEPPADDVSWREHVVTTVDHEKFKDKKIGDLSPRQLKIIEAQWLPIVLQGWNEATEAQQADATAFQKALAFHESQSVLKQ